MLPNYIDYIPNEVQRLYKINPEKPMLPLTFDEQDEYDKAKKCHICIDPFNDPKNYKVRDHCHFTGHYRGAAHRNCNLNYKIANEVNIEFHNFSGYDSHLYNKGIS